VHETVSSYKSFYWNENETPIGIHLQLLAFYCNKDTVDITTVCHWVSKSRESGGNLGLNDPPRSVRLVAATHDLEQAKN
jgi:hypothetical protein